MEKLLDTIITSRSLIEARNMKFLCVLQENPQRILHTKTPTYFVLCAFSSKENVIIALCKKMLMCYFLCSFSVLCPTNFIISFKEETAILLFVFFFYKKPYCGTPKSFPLPSLFKLGVFMWNIMFGKFIFTMSEAFYAT